MSTLAHEPSQAAAPAVPVKRRWRNYLLDARFQLKFTGYILAIALSMAGVLGIFLWRSSQTLMHEVADAVEARSRAAETSRALSTATLNNELMEHFDDPAFEKELAAQAQRIDQEYEAERQAIVQQRAELERRQRVTWLALVGCLAAFVLFITLATIMATHKIVGPLFRIKRLVGEVSEGKLTVPTYPLRQGDELQDVFEGLTRMVQGLRARQTDDIQSVNAAVARAETADPGLAADLRQLEGRMRGRLK